MTAALAVIAVVALVAILALVVVARRASATANNERARGDRLQAQVQALEGAQAAVDVRPAPAAPEPEPASAPAVPARDTPDRSAAPAPADAAEPPTPIAGPADESAASAESASADSASAESASAASAEEATPVAAGSTDVVDADEPAAGEPEPSPLAAAPPAGASSDEPPTAGPTAEEPATPEPPAPPVVPIDEPPAAGTGSATPLPVSSDRAGTNSHGGVAAEPLLELERLRLEREWADIVGPSTPLPVPWDGSVRSVVAVELDIIREVIGTPSRIEPAGPSQPAEPALAVATARLATEILRRLAKAGEEISVTFVTDTDVTMAIATEGNEVKPDLSDLTSTAVGLGGRLTLLETEEGFEAQLRVPSSLS